MRDAGTLRKRVGSFAFGLFCVDVLAYVGKFLLPRTFYSTHADLVAIYDELGLLVGAIVLILTIIGAGRFKPAVIVGSLVVTYLWFSGVAWWVMAK